MKYIIGIDEVGRGPIAGPVAVCAFLCKEDFFDHHPALVTKHPSSERRGSNALPPLRDSKKLSKIQREKWFEYLKSAKAEGLCNFIVSYVSAENIDKFGINKCIKKALEKSLYGVIEKENQKLANYFRFTLKGSDTIKNFANHSFVTISEISVFLDGGLKAPEEFVHQLTSIKGDELYPVISCASIVAKVSRDKVMTNYAKEYLNYGFDKHSGYGTSAHYQAIKTEGLTSIHRKTFIS